MRLQGASALADELLKAAVVIEVDMVFDDPAAPGMIIDKAVQAARTRLLRKG